MVKKVSAEGKPPNRRITLGFADSSKGRLFFARRISRRKTMRSFINMKKFMPTSCFPILLPLFF